MKVFYTVSFYGKEKYQAFYDMALRAIEATGAEVISPEKGNYKSVLSEKIINSLRDEAAVHYEAIKKGILLADAVIIEASHEDFQLGYEAAFAVDSKKPLLCLSVNENFSDKIKYRYFSGSKYNEYNIEEIVENFIEKVKTDLYSERFNCFLTPTQLKYLESASKEAGVNKSEYLRSLIDNDRMKVE